jgi:hypothetical protein
MEICAPVGLTKLFCNKNPQRTKLFAHKAIEKFVGSVLIRPILSLARTVFVFAIPGKS